MSTLEEYRHAEMQKLKNYLHNLLKENVTLAGSALSFERRYHILKEQFENLKSKEEILKQLKNEMITHEEKRNNTYFYEEGRIDILLWLLSLPKNTKIEEINKMLEKF